MKTQPHHKLQISLCVYLALGIAVFQIVSQAPAQQTVPAQGAPAQLYRVSGVSNGIALDPFSKEVEVARANGIKPAGRITPVDRSSFVALRQIRKGDQVALPLSDRDTVTGIAHLVQNDGKTISVAGELSGKKAGTFCITTTSTEVSGVIDRIPEGIAYRVEQDSAGAVILREMFREDVICGHLPRMQNEESRAALGQNSVLTIPVLNSRPSAVAQLYLDFDGETVTDPLWNGGQTIVAPPYNLSSADITATFQRVAEDYLPFNVNITTDVQKYINAPVGRRMRCIITPNNAAAPGAGGVAYLNSFAQAGTGSFTSNIPCWVFNSSVVGISEAVSHECGHTFGLHHDGREIPGQGHEEYFQGQGSGATGWCPLMGASYYEPVTQWSKGEYQYANNFEDDVSIISGSANGFGFVADEAGNSIASAATVNAPGGSVNQTGVVSRSTDSDFFSFTTAGGGTVSITASGATPAPDLDIGLELQNASGAVLASSLSPSSLNASISTSVSAGTYYVKVYGTAALDPFTNGYSNYASIGAYTLSGSVPSGGTGNLPNLTFYRPSGWSNDLVISRVPNTNVDDTSLSDADTLYLDIAPLNNGLAPTTQTWHTKVFVDGSEVNDAAFSSQLDPNFYFTILDRSLGSLTAGTHTIRVVVDALNNVSESNESATDNERTRTVTITNSQLTNDNFASARTLSGSSGSVAGNTIGATREAGEPNHAGNSGGASIWYRWTAPGAGSVTMDTVGSNFDTLLAVYSGSSLNALTVIASNDDDPTDFVLTSRLTFNAVAGATYFIAIDGYNGVNGLTNLNWQAQTTNATLTVVANPTNGGTVTGGGTYPVGSSRQISATANSGWTFTGWNDGNTADSRTVTVPTGGITYTANFSPIQSTATITVLTSPSNGGTVTGGGTYTVGSSRQISASANAGFTFTGWSDGNTQNPRTITVPAGGAIYTAIFASSAVATPQFSPAGGSFRRRVTITMTCATSGASIYYTINGVTPTTASSRYTGPITFSSRGTRTVRAIAVKSGFTNSGVRSGTFTVR